MYRMSTLSVRPVLNYDILLAIMSQCDSQSTISRMMQTCRYLSDKGDRYLLRNGVTIGSVSALHGFFRFLVHFGFAARAPFSTMRYRTASGRLLVPRTTKRYAPGQVSLPRERTKSLTFTS